MNLQKTWAWIIGLLFLLIGIIGLFTDKFPINSLHDGIHLASGFIWIWAAKMGPTKAVNRWFGLFYIVIGILGFVGLMNFIQVDLQINIFHLAVAGGVSALIGFLSK